MGLAVMGLFGSSPPPPPPPPAPAAPIGAKTPRTLTAQDLEAASQIVGTRSKLAIYRVPRGELLELDAVKPFRLQIKALHTAQITADSSGNATVDLANSGLELVRSARPAPAGATRDHPDVVAYAVPVGGGSRLKRTVASYNPANSTVGLSGLTAGTTYALDLYVTHGNGSFRLVAVKPSGMDSREIELYNDTFRALHETDQASGVSAPRLMRGGQANFPLAPKWELALEVESDVFLAWTPEAENILRLPGYRLPVAVRDAAALNSTVSRRLR